MKFLKSHRNSIRIVSPVRDQFQFDEHHSLKNEEEAAQWQQDEFYCYIAGVKKRLRPSTAIQQPNWAKKKGNLLGRDVDLFELRLCLNGFDPLLLNIAVGCLPKVVVFNQTGGNLPRQEIIANVLEVFAILFYS